MSRAGLSASEVLSRPKAGQQDEVGLEARDADAISLPDRFKDGDDPDIELASPPRSATMAFAQHSLFGVIAAAQANEPDPQPDTCRADNGEAEDRDQGDELFAQDLSKAVPDLRSSEPAPRHFGATEVARDPALEPRPSERHPLDTFAGSTSNLVAKPGSLQAIPDRAAGSSSVSTLRLNDPISSTTVEGQSSTLR